MLESGRDEGRTVTLRSIVYASSRARHFAIPNSLKMVGLSRFELLTPRLSSVCSNQLSYRPVPVRSSPPLVSKSRPGNPGPVLSKLDRTCALTCRVPDRSFQAPSPAFASDDAPARSSGSRKEVIQPQVLLQLPCYDFTPITDHTLGTCLPCGLAR